MSSTSRQMTASTQSSMCQQEMLSDLPLIYQGLFWTSVLIFFAAIPLYCVVKQKKNKRKTQ